MGFFQVFWRCRWECLLQGPCTKKTVSELQLGCAGAQLQGPFRIYSLTWLGLVGQPPGASSLCWDGLEQVHGPLRNEELGLRSICLSPDSQMDLTLPRPLDIWCQRQNQSQWGCSWVLRVWSCFQVCSWDHGQWVNDLGVSLTSKNDSPWSWTALRFHSLLVSKAPMQALLFMDGCQIILVERWTGVRDILFGHLANFTLFWVHFKACISHAGFDKNSHPCLPSRRSIPDTW